MEERITEEERARFSQAIDIALKKESPKIGIGQLSEKKLHLTLKYFYQPDESFHEQQIGSYFADAVTVDGIVEIQTANYGNLCKKLDIFAPLVPVTVVCPIPHKKTITWIDPVTGEFLREGKSTKTGSVYDVFWEMAHLKERVLMKNVTFRVLLMDVKEYRYLNGRGQSKKRGSTRFERIPVSLSGAYSFSTREDFLALLPRDLPSPFTRKELFAELPSRSAPSFLYVLRQAGLVSLAGKRGKAHLYEICR